MTEIRVTTQQKLDETLAREDINYSAFEIIIDSPRGVWLTLSDSKGLDVRASGSASVEASGSASVRAFGSASVEAFGSASVRAFGSASVEASGSASVRAFDSASVRAFDSASVRAFGSASVRAFDSASVRAFGSASVRAFDSASVRAFDSASVRASGSASVRAFDSASVRAFDSASVEAFDSASVRASDSASVRAFDSASVRAFGSASVRAFDSASVQAGRYVAVHLHSQRVTLQGGVLIDMTQLDRSDPATWCELMGVEVDDAGLVHLYKAVDDDLYAGHAHVKTQYPIDGDPECDVWRDDNDCGAGLHACPTPSLAQDHYPAATRFLEVTAPMSHLRPIDSTKAKAPTVHVLREVDLMGRPVGGEDL